MAENKLFKDDDDDQLWGPGVDISFDEFQGYFRQLIANGIDVDNMSKLTYAEMDRINERFARYRLGFYKMFIADPEENLRLKDPTDYSPYELGKEGYFKRYEKDGSLDVYHSYFNAYEIDCDYVKYCEELSEKIKWIQDYVLLNRFSPQWKEMDNRAWFQAAKIATGFRFMTLDLAHTAYMDHIMRLREVEQLENYIGAFFEIWKLVTNENFDACIKDIPNNAEEAEVLNLIKRGVYRKLPTTVTMWEYAAKKIKIAKQIGLIDQPDHLHRESQDLKV
uniref:Uncharacterized protein n=1 Tax=Leersia perrieri TaxID=77586 RepID=A0A0D9VAL2_9ORYZ